VKFLIPFDEIIADFIFCTLNIIRMRNKIKLSQLCNNENKRKISKINLKKIVQKIPRIIL
jgi:hypothetical protein